MKILISIKPHYAHKILNGEKLFELRKSIPKKKFDTVIIYSSSPEKKVIGEFKIDGIIHKNIDELRNIVKDYACVNKKFFDEYFKGKDKGYAFKIKSVKKYREFELITKYINHPPQNFAYIN